MDQNIFYPKLTGYLAGIESEFENIPEERLESLHYLADSLSSYNEEGKTALLLFICTHNSRRSQFGQAWAGIAARYYGYENLEAFSGGTDSSAFNPAAVAALKRSGLAVSRSGTKDDNPVYEVSCGEGVPPVKMYSKKFDQSDNPGAGFFAIMVCSDADEACPIVPGAEERISLPYDDPKAFDGTPIECEKYDESCREIARDIFYSFRQVTK